jgi:protein-tyrosine phosphatase
MRRIEPYPLWLGHVGDARNPRRVLDAGIAALVDLALEELPAVKLREVVYCRFPLEDGTGNTPELLSLTIKTVAGLLTAHTPTLVFCGAGMSRSPAIASAALALFTGWPCDECLKLIKKVGPADVSPGLWQNVHDVWASLAKRRT